MFGSRHGFGFELNLRDKFSRNTRQSRNELNKLDKGFTRAQKGAKSFGRSMAKITGLGLGVVGAYKVASSSIKRFATFDEEMRKVQTLLVADYGGEKARDLTDSMAVSVRKLALAYGQEAAPMAKALWLAVSSGIEAGEPAIDFLENLGRQAVITQADMSVMTRMITDVMDNYGASAGTAAEISDAMFAAMAKGKLDFAELASAMSTVLPVTAKLGWSWKEAASGIVALTRGAGNAAEGATKFKSIASALLGMTPLMRKEFAQMGIDMSRTSISARGLMGNISFIQDSVERIDFRKAGVELKTLGLRFKGAHLQGMNAAVAAQWITKRLNEVAKTEGGTKKAAVALLQLGIRMRGTEWESLGYQKQLTMINSSLKENRFHLAKVFRDTEAMTGAFHLAGKGGKVVQDTLDMIAKGGVVSAEAFEAMADTPAQKFRLLKVLMQDFQMRLGAKLYPTVLKVMNLINRVDWDKVVGSLESLLDKLGWLMSKDTGGGFMNSLGMFGKIMQGAAGFGGAVFEGISGRKIPEEGKTPTAQTMTATATTYGFMKPMLAWLKGSGRNALGQFVKNPSFWRSLGTGLLKGGIYGAITAGVNEYVAGQVRKYAPREVETVRAVLGISQIQSLAETGSARRPELEMNPEAMAIARGRRGSRIGGDVSGVGAGGVRDPEAYRRVWGTYPPGYTPPTPKIGSGAAGATRGIDYERLAATVTSALLTAQGKTISVEELTKVANIFSDAVKRQRVNAVISQRQVFDAVAREGDRQAGRE